VENNHWPYRESNPKTSEASSSPQWPCNPQADTPYTGCQKNLGFDDQQFRQILKIDNPTKHVDQMLNWLWRATYAVQVQNYKLGLSYFWNCTPGRLSANKYDSSCIATWHLCLWFQNTSGTADSFSLQLKAKDGSFLTVKIIQHYWHDLKEEGFLQQNPARVGGHTTVPFCFQGHTPDK
jgi:hypothetical protein